MPCWCSAKPYFALHARQLGESMAVRDMDFLSLGYRGQSQPYHMTDCGMAASATDRLCAVDTRVRSGLLHLVTHLEHCEHAFLEATLVREQTLTQRTATRS